MSLMATQNHYFTFQYLLSLLPLYTVCKPKICNLRISIVSLNIYRLVVSYRTVLLISV